ARSAVHTCRPQCPHAARCSAQAPLPHTGHSSTSSDAKNAIASSAQPARCRAHTRRRDLSVRRKCREQCTCPSTAHTASCAVHTDLPQLAHSATSSTPTGSLVPPSQYLRHAVHRRRLPFGASAPLCSACRLHTTRPQLPQGARQAEHAVCPSSAQTPSWAVQCCRRHEGQTRTCSSHAGCSSTRHWAMPWSLQKSSAQTEQRVEHASQPQ